MNTTFPLDVRRRQKALFLEGMRHYFEESHARWLVEFFAVALMLISFIVLVYVGA